MIVDTHPEAVYERGHIPGAVNLPWAMHIKGPVNLPRNKLLILYCACAHEATAEDVATQLIHQFGYKDLKLLAGGWLRWVELGYPIDPGTLEGKPTPARVDRLHCTVPFNLTWQTTSSVPCGCTSAGFPVARPIGRRWLVDRLTRPAAAACEPAAPYVQP